MWTDCHINVYFSRADESAACLGAAQQIDWHTLQACLLVADASKQPRYLNIPEGYEFPMGCLFDNWLLEGAGGNRLLGVIAHPRPIRVMRRSEPENLPSVKACFDQLWDAGIPVGACAVVGGIRIFRSKNEMHDWFAIVPTDPRPKEATANFCTYPRIDVQPKSC